MNAYHFCPIRLIRLLRSLCPSLILMIFTFNTVLLGTGLPTGVITGSGPIAQLSVTLFVIPSGATSGECTTWGTACDLQYALTKGAAPAELWVKMGMYTPTSGTDQTASFQLKNGVILYGGFSGIETVSDQREPGVNLTTLSGEIGSVTTYDNSFHVVAGNGTNTTAVLDGFTINAGNATGAAPNNRAGGGMVIVNGSPTLTNVTFSNNSASSNGGGLYSSGGGPELNNVTFIGNNAGSSGGGMFIVSGSPVLSNVTFSGNTAVYYGGGLTSSSSSPALNNVTLSGNTANQGGGIYNLNSSNLEIVNSLLWGNTLDQIKNEADSIVSVSYSDVQGGYLGEGNLNLNPVLGAIQYYGGATPVYPLLPGSAAINTGNDTSCASTDQRGIARPQLALCDMGAYESRGFNLSSTSGNNQSTPVSTDFVSPLVVSVTSVFAEPVDGGYVAFTPPATGASAVLSGNNPAQITSGFAQVDAVANDIPGTYQVLAGAAGASDEVNFSLNNLPGAFSKNSPINGAVDQQIAITLSWESSAGAVSYAYCIDTTDNSACDGDAWHSAGICLSVDLSSLKHNTNYYWQVRAGVESLLVLADADTWWHFTTEKLFLVYLPAVRR